MTRRARAWFLALTLALAARYAAAGPPIGSFELEIDESNPIWLAQGEDVSRICRALAVELSPLEQCDVEIEVDAKGRISGAANASGWEGDLFVSLEGRVSGKRRSTRSEYHTLANYTLDLVGLATGNGISETREARVGLSLILPDPGTLVFFLRWCRGEEACREGVLFSPGWLGRAAEGEWTLALGIDDAGRGRLLAHARVRVADGSLCDFAGHGRYDAKRDLAKLGFVPTTPACAGMKLQLRKLRLTDRLESVLRYALFGQKGELSMDLPVDPR